MLPRLLGGRIMRRDDAGRTLGRARILFGLVFEQLLSPAHGLCHALLVLAYVMHGLVLWSLENPTYLAAAIPIRPTPHPGHSRRFLFGGQMSCRRTGCRLLAPDGSRAKVMKWWHWLAASSIRAHPMSSSAARAGAFSRQTESSYWKEKKKRWEQLYKAAAALGSSDPASKRPDFSPAEFGVGTPLYFVQDDTEPIGPSCTSCSYVNARRRASS